MMNRAYNDDDHVGFQAGVNPEWPLSLPHTTTTSMATTCQHHDQDQHLPHDHYSWSQLLLGGLMGEDEQDKVMMMINNHVFQESLEESSDLVRQEEEPYHNSHDDVHQDFGAASNNWFIMPTSFMSSSNMLDFSSKNPPPYHHHQSSSECMSSSTGGAAKKARVQPSSSPTPSSFMVMRKEKLGDRIATLHQLVSPFGKTDTASVLLESIGYIRFLHTQIQALTLPYLDNKKSGQQCMQGEMNSIFPQDPGQLLNENCIKTRNGATNQIPNEQAKKDLRSRGLCLVPVPCTPQVGNNNVGSDYWAPAAAVSGSGCF